MEDFLKFQIFTKERCDLCQKAQDVLQRFGIEPQVRYVEGPHATAEDIAEFSWYDWVDITPLVVVTQGDTLVRRWDSEAVKRGMMPKVHALLKERPLIPAAPSS